MIARNHYNIASEDNDDDDDSHPERVREIIEGLHNARGLLERGVETGKGQRLHPTCIYLSFLIQLVSCRGRLLDLNPIRLSLDIDFILACILPLQRCPAIPWCRKVLQNIAEPTPGLNFAQKCLIHVLIQMSHSQSFQIRLLLLV